MKTKYSSTVLALLTVQAALTAPLAGAAGDPFFDRHAAIEIGDYKVSRYLVAKYYGRFSEQLQLTQHRLPTDREAKDWFDLFVAKQITIAHAETSGYATRPDVGLIVSHMERSMLTQPVGALFRSYLEKQGPPSSSDLKELHQQVANLIDATVARFPNPQAARDHLGSDFNGLPVEEQTARVQKCVNLEGVAVQEKRLSWPYLPFSEIAATLERAPISHWIDTALPGYGEYYIFVRERINRPISHWKTDDEGFREWVEYKRLQGLYQQFQTKSLLSAVFTLDSSTAHAVLEHCIYTMSEHYEIPAFPTEAMADSILFSYLIASKPQLVTAEQFRLYFNQQYIRSGINDFARLRQDCEDMATEELSYRSAKAQGLDRTPQFSEDRFGFTGFQVLDCFEKEQLVPGISIEPGRIEKYYKVHAAEYLQPLKIRGRLVAFARLDDAARWKAEAPAQAEADCIHDPALISEEVIEVGLAEPVPGLGLFHDLLFTCPEGTVIGPVQHGGRYICFLKERNLLFGSRPLELMVDIIRETLMRQELDSLELKLAGGWSAGLHLKIESLEAIGQGQILAQLAQ